MKRVISLILCLCMLLSSLSSAQAIMLPSAVRHIEAEALAGDKSIKGQLVLPENVQSVGDRAFADTDVFRLIMPPAMDEIGSRILEGSGATYVVAENGNPSSVAGDAFAGVKAVLTPAGGSIADLWCNWHATD